MSASQTYLHLARELLRVRREHGEDSPHEDEILDQMDQPWYDMTSGRPGGRSQASSGEHQ